MDTEAFHRLCHSTDDYTWIEQKNSQIINGNVTFTEIDAMNNLENLDCVKVYGLKQEAFDYFVRTQGHKSRAIMFWKNKLVEDWSSLSTLKNVEFIGFFHNQRITELWDMQENQSLKGLYISDFTRLHSLEGIQFAPSLERVFFGDAVWPTSVLDDLSSLERHPTLKEFTFSGKGIKEEDLSIYTTIPHLEVLDFSPKLYTTEQLAWLTAMLPNVKGYALRPYIQLQNSYGEKDVLICGKRKPSLSSEKDQLKIQKYVTKFQELVQKVGNEEFI